MIRKIITINEEKCNGCGLCVKACHEGALTIVTGKAKLMRDDYCDGLGNCLPVCPAGAISFEEREANAYDEAAVKAKEAEQNTAGLSCGCPGTQSNLINRAGSDPRFCDHYAPLASRLSQWPVQIKLVPVSAHYFENADLLIAADCTAFAYGDFHNGFIRGRITLIGCPKLDAADYSEKLTAIIKNNSIKSVTVVRMEVPCCGGLEAAVKTAINSSGKTLLCQVVTISADGRILDEEDI